MLWTWRRRGAWATETQRRSPILATTIPTSLDRAYANTPKQPAVRVPSTSRGDPRLLMEALAGERPPTPKSVADAQRQHDQWVEQLVDFRKRVAGLAIEPRSRRE